MRSWPRTVLLLSFWGVAVAAGPPHTEAPLLDRKLALDLGIAIDGVSGPWRFEQKLFAPAPPITSSSADGKWNPMPPPRFASGVAGFDSLRNRMVVVFDHQAWVLHLSGGLPRWEVAEIPGVMPRVIDDSAVFDRSNNRILFLGAVDGRFAVYALWLTEPMEWERLDTGGGNVPFPRQYQSVALDSARGRLIMFGGWDRTGLLADVWAFDSSSRSWTHLVIDGERPRPRVSSSAIYDPSHDRILVHGGAVEREPRILEATDELWSLDMRSHRWTSMPTHGTSPGPRSFHTGHYDVPSGRILYFLSVPDTSDARVVFELGGDDTLTWRRVIGLGDENRRRRGNAVAYDSRRDRYLVSGGNVHLDLVDVDAFALRPSPAWERFEGQALPPSRFGHAIIHDLRRDRIVIFGGVGSTFEYRADVWSASLAEPWLWDPVTVSDSMPPPRHEPVAVYDPKRDRMVMFGGTMGFGNYLNDTWVLEFGDPAHWSRVSPLGDVPAGRRAHTAIYDPIGDQMIVFGGANSQVAFGDVWSLNLAAPMRWKRLETSGDAPTGRYFPSAIYDPLRDRMIVHGGGIAGRSTGETWALDLRRFEWTLVANGADRERHTIAFDLQRDRVIMFGGWIGDYDVAAWTPETRALEFAPEPRWSWLSPRGEPPFKAGHTALYDPRRDRMVLVAGLGFSFDFDNDTWLLEFDGAIEHRAWLLYARQQPGVMNIAWHAVHGTGTEAAIQRRGLGEQWMTLGSAVADSDSRITFTDATVRPGWRYDYRLLVGNGSGAQAAGAATIDTEGESALNMLGAWPNPAQVGSMRLWMALAANAPATVELFDVQGRKAWKSRFTPSSSGVQSVRVAASLAPGLYLARLEQRGQAVTRKITVLSSN